MSTVEEILMVKGPDVIVSSPTSSVAEAVKLMADARVGSLIVKDGEDVVGIFTERDLLCRVVARDRDPEALMLADVMSSPVATCGLGDDVRDVADMLAEQHIRHLVVVDGGAVVGMIGARDLLAAELRDSRERMEALRQVD